MFIHLGTMCGALLQYDTIRHFRNEIKCPAKKLVLGMPFYGQSYTIESSLTPEFGVAVSGPGVAGTYTKSAGTLAYYEVSLALLYPVKV